MLIYDFNLIGGYFMAKRKNEIVKKSNDIIRASWTVDSVWEPRIVAHLAAKIHVKDENFKVYEVSIADILGHQYGGHDLKELEKTVDNLLSRPITIYESSTRTAKYNIFSKCVIDSKKGILELEFHTDLKPHFLQLQKNFTQYSLTEFLSLSSIYSQRLYELLKSYRGQGYIDLTLDELHKALDFPVALRNNFYNFRKKVLEQADKEIVRGNLSLQYRWMPIKSGRGGKVTAIRFSFGGDKALREGDDEELIRAKLAKQSSSCYFGLMKRKVECTPKPTKSAKCKYCVEHGNMSLRLKAKKGRAAPIGGAVE
jgi:plasmid replication initiation protein